MIRHAVKRTREACKATKDLSTEIKISPEQPLAEVKPKTMERGEATSDNVGGGRVIESIEHPWPNNNNEDDGNDG